MLRRLIQTALLITLITSATMISATSGAAQPRRPVRPSPSQNNDDGQKRRLGVSSNNGAQTERRVALVIGNSSYSSAPLLNPANDARAMSAALKEMGFDVSGRANLTMREMKAAIREFGSKIQNGGVGLFYFAGHGVQTNGKNYLIPVDAQIEKEADVDIEGIDLGSVMIQMEGAKNRLNIVILDACRNNPFARSWRSASRGLAQVNAPSGTFIAYATAPGSTASDGAGQNGLYTQELLKAMRQPGLRIEEVFKQVRIRVKDQSNGSQVPWDASSLEGEFFFTPGGSSPAIANTPVNKLNSPNSHSGTQPSPDVKTSDPDTKTVAPAPPKAVAMRSSVSLDVIQRNFQSNLIDEVIRDAQAYLASQPDDAQVNWYLGTSYFLRHNYLAGIPYLTKAFEAGMAVSFIVQRHRVFITSESLEPARLTVRKEGLELAIGKDTVKVPFNQIREFNLENGGMKPNPRLHLKVGVVEKDGKIKDKIFNLYAPLATIEEGYDKNNSKTSYVTCGNCTPWTTAVMKFINSVPR